MRPGRKASLCVAFCSLLSRVETLSFPQPLNLLERAHAEGLVAPHVVPDCVDLDDELCYRSKARSARNAPPRGNTKEIFMSEEAPSKPAGPPQDLKDMADLVSLCKRRGFVFPSSEIY